MGWKPSVNVDFSIHTTDPKWASSRSDSLLVSRHMGNAANYGEILDV